MNSIKILNKCEPLMENVVLLQFLRWKRKPIGLPTAKSKLFKVPPRQKMPVEEYEELKRLFNNYRTVMKSINQFLSARYNTKYLQQDDHDLKTKLFENDLIISMKLNDEWNAKQKILREQRTAKEYEEELQKALERIEKEDKKLQDEAKLIEEIVFKQKEEAKHFIMADRLDEVIESTYLSPIDKNFALDVEGNKITSDEPKKEPSIIKI